MEPTRVRTKKQMFGLLQKGAFGNTIERWFNLKDWVQQRPANVSLWAIRSAVVASDPRTILDLKTDDLPHLYKQWYPDGGGEISPMVDHMLTHRLHVHQDRRGWVLWGVTGLRHIKWRDAFRYNSYHLYGLEATLALRSWLNPSSLDDLYEVCKLYDGHVVEMTVLDRCYGTVPHRNAVVWEVRDY